MKKEDCQYMRALDAARYLGIGKSTFWAWHAQGVLPQGIRLSNRVTVWRVEDLNEFIARRIGEMGSPFAGNAGYKNMKTVPGTITEPDILRGWKEIERYVGMGRKAILRAGYPVRCEGGDGVTRRNIYAIRKELLNHALNGARLSTDGAV